MMGLWSWLTGSTAAPVVAAPAPPAPAAPDNFDACVTIILQHEGGFVDNPNDRGGATNFGITEATLDEWRRGNGLPPSTVDDVRSMSIATAKAIYRANFWPTYALPPGIDLSVMDSDVMSGMSVGAKFLQGALGVAQDGRVGPATLAALKAAPVLSVIRGIAAQRAAFYRGLVVTRPADGVFLTGWLNRVNQTLSQSLVMAAGLPS